uniref:Uncharacterized protein n=1 Tax=Peronospora matthiolae TaxID=2874970 RepID=A0AAV1V168_9STRA
MTLINLFTLFVCVSLSIVIDLNAAPGVLRVPTEQEHVGALVIKAMEKSRASSSSGTKWLPNLLSRVRLRFHPVEPRDAVCATKAIYDERLNTLEAKLKSVTPVDVKEPSKLKEELNVVLDPRTTLAELLWNKDTYLKDILKQADQTHLNPFDRAYLVVKSDQFQAIYEHLHLHDETLVNKALVDKALFDFVGGFDHPKEVAELLFLAGKHDKDERVKMYAAVLQDFQFQCWKVRKKSPESVALEVFGVNDVSPQQLEENPVLKGILDSYSKYMAKGMAPELPK